MYAEMGPALTACQMSLPLSELDADLARLRRSNLIGNFHVMSALPFIRSQALSVAPFLIVGPHGMEVDSQTDGLLLNVSLPLPTLPEVPDRLKEMASDETWETYGSRRRLVLLRGGRDA